MGFTEKRYEMTRMMHMKKTLGSNFVGLDTGGHEDFLDPLTNGDKGRAKT